MRRVALAAALIGAAIGTCGVAQANEDQYLAYLRNHGFGGGSDWAGQAIAEGQLQCQQMRKGRSEYDVAYDLEATMSNAEATSIVAAAHQYLCPDAPAARATQWPKR
jgi:Protein of unknown function (DUF732)